MVGRIIDFSARNRFIVFLLLFGGAMAGWLAWRNTPIDTIPDISDTQVIIYTTWMGRSPDLVEDQITYPIVTALLSAPRVTAVRSFSDFGFSYVYVLFKDGTDIYWARSRVLEYMNQLAGRLPEGVTPQLGPDATAVGWILQYALVDESGEQDLASLRSFQDWSLRYWLRSVDGVAEVASVGGFVRQYQVNLNPTKLLAYNLSLPEVIEKIRMSNNDVGGRVVEFAGTEYMIRGRGYIKSTSDVAQIAVGVNQNGTPILLRDVASVRLGPDMRRGLAELDGQGEVVGGIVVMRFGENAPQVIEHIKPRAQWRAGLAYEGLVEAMDKALQLPGVTNAWTMPIKARVDMLTTGVRTPVGIKIFGPDLKQIEQLGKHIEMVAQGVPGTRSVYAERVSGGYFLDFDIKREEIARYGLTVMDVGRIIESAIGGESIATTVERRERYPINVRYLRELRDDPDKLRRVLVATPTGAQIPLAQLTTLRFQSGPAMIRDEDGMLSGYVYVDMAGRDIGGYVEELKRVVRQQVELPPGYTLAWSGQYEFMQRVQERLQIFVPLTVAIIFVLFYFTFRSVTETLMVMLGVPFALVGGLWYLVWLEYNMSIAVWVGLIALAGLANILGLLPVMWATGTGADVMKRLAAPMVGGVLSAMLLTLVVIPALYAIWRWHTDVQRQAAAGQVQPSVLVSGESPHAS